MRDLDVRLVLRRELNRQHCGDDRTRIVEEMGLWSGAVRVDVAVINGELCGYEIKSARDTLARLPSQQNLYSQVFDRVTLVLAEGHAEKATTLVPSWWGIWLASVSEDNHVQLASSRLAADNPTVNPLQVARLLWRAEAIAVLERRGLAKGYKGAPVEKIFARLAGELPIVTLRTEVREALKARTNWSRKSAEDKREMSVRVDLDPLRATSSAHAGIIGNAGDTLIAPAVRKTAKV